MGTTRTIARAVGLASLGLLLGAATASAQDASAVERGAAKYRHTCAPCHGRGLGNDGRPRLPGTAALEIKYRGAVPAVLEDRPGLTADVLKVFLRRGSMSMPPFRPTEVTDADIADIAAYLAESSSKAAANAPVGAQSDSG